MGVRFSPDAPLIYCEVAQMVEQMILIHLVEGSIPLPAAILKEYMKLVESVRQLCECARELFDGKKKQCNVCIKSKVCKEKQMKLKQPAK